MVSNRAYRQGLPTEVAVQNLQERAGTQFDPNLVRLFVDVLPEAIQEVQAYEKEMYEAKQQMENPCQG